MDKSCKLKFIRVKGGADVHGQRKAPHIQNSTHEWYTKNEMQPRHHMQISPQTKIVKNWCIRASSAGRCKAFACRAHRNGLADRCAALQQCDVFGRRRPTRPILRSNLHQLWVGGGRCAQTIHLLDLLWLGP
jgi:hypothetical protein